MCVRAGCLVSIWYKFCCSVFRFGGTRIQTGLGSSTNAYLFCFFFELFFVVVVLVFGNSIEFSYRADCIRTHVSENAMRTLATCNLHIFCSFVRKRSVHLLFRKFFFHVSLQITSVGFVLRSVPFAECVRCEFYFFSSSTGDNWKLCLNRASMFEFECKSAYVGSNNFVA